MPQNQILSGGYNSPFPGNNSQQVGYANGTTVITAATYAAKASDMEIDVNNASNSVVVTAPPPAAFQCRSFRIKKVNLTGGAYSISLARYGTESIEGVAATYVLPGSDDSGLRAWEFVSNGTNWYLRADRSSPTANDLDPLAVYPSYGLKHYVTLGSDFGSVSNIAPFYSTVNGSGAALAASTATAGRVGVITASTGTTTSGYATLNTDPASIVLSNGAVRFRCDIQLSALSDGTDTYTARFGLGDVATGAEPTDGVYFRYTHSVNSGKWVCVTRSNGTETATNSTGAAVAATTWLTLECEINAAGTSATFYANGVLQATNTTNIPTGAGRETGVQMSILKSAGTTARLVSLDQAWIRQAASTNV
jgi:hypothetical protein